MRVTQTAGEDKKGRHKIITAELQRRDRLGDVVVGGRKIFKKDKNWV